ncbi:MAG: ABC transporter ATP-binding protein [Pseudomonadota bacterium]|nr:ABC transporter ATP-binding protein [Pseudomonadota bacterium]
MPDAPVLLSVRDLSVTFHRQDEAPLAAVRGFSLDIREGEFVGLMGEPGCGKSTAAIALMGLVKPPGRIDGGSVMFRGRDLLAMSQAEQASLRGGEIGLIVQNPRTSLHPLLNVGTQIANVYRAHEQASAAAAWDRAIEMLRLVGINDPARRARAFPHELSTGMTQRVLIAMALSSRPRLLIADEPTSGLDVTIQTQFLDQMWQATQATGSAVLLVTQNLGIVANYCDRVVIMKDGTIVETAPALQFFRQPESAYAKRVLALQRAGAGGSAGLQQARSADLADAATLVEVRGLSKDFAIRGSKAKVHAADQVSFAIGVGECLGIVGESGSGKTTTGRCLLRLETPTAGELLFRGESLTELSEAAFRPYRAKMQIVFQDPFDSMNPRWSVADVIGELLALHTTLGAAARQRRIDELLTLVGLDPRLKAMSPRQLSAGRQQRVAIARAIATEPDFVVLDEPTSALTPETTAEIIQLLMELSRRLGISYLFISHDLTTVEYICHRVAVMYLGQVVEIGTKEQVFHTPAHPYTRALLAAHLFPDAENRRVDQQSRPTLAGEIPSPIDLPQGCYLYGRCPSQTERCATMKQALRALPDGRELRCWRVAEGEIPVAPAC